jgi:hypothetical protein
MWELRGDENGHSECVEFERNSEYRKISSSAGTIPQRMSAERIDLIHIPQLCSNDRYVPKFIL